MSAANTTKPPRPCTEYNIFFQLERAYIIQVLLRSQPSLDPSEVFCPSQPSYAGLPPLPARYAQLVLPYDWHLPGKEQRRRRKHRKSHGAIGFHELSARVCDAWRDADVNIKAYCKVVRSAGVAKYKAAMTEWKRDHGGRPAAPQEEDRPKAATAAVGAAPATQEPAKIERGTDAAGGEDALRAPLDELDLPNVARDEALLPVTATFTAEEMNRAFENDLPLAWDEPAALAAAAVPSAGHVFKSRRTSVEMVFALWNNENAVPSAGAVHKSRRKSKRTSVDMDDGEIFALWNKENAVAPVTCANHWESDLKFHPTFGSKGYAQTMKNRRLTKELAELMGLEVQIAKLQKMNGRPRPKQRSMAARSA